MTETTSPLSYVANNQEIIKSPTFSADTNGINIQNNNREVLRLPNGTSTTRITSKKKLPFHSTRESLEMLEDIDLDNSSSSLPVSSLKF